MALPQMTTNHSNGGNNITPQTRAVIERGASWSYNETRILLSLWGQDMVQRQLTNSKRTRHVWEKIADRIREHGFERTADQVRTRVFNMIAEYRRILKNPTPERKKKCIFFDALNKIYQAKDTNGVKAALNNYEEDYNIDPIDFSNNDGSNDGGVDNCDGENSTENEEVFAYTFSPSQLNGGGMNGNQIEDDSMDGHINMTSEVEVENGHPNSKHMRTEQMPQYQANQFRDCNSFDNSSAALLIDRMFTHLSREADVMREWINLEKERYTREISRRKEENDREEKRERNFLQALMKMQEQTFAFLSKQQHSITSSQQLFNATKPHHNHLNNQNNSPSDLTSSTTPIAE